MSRFLAGITLILLSNVSNATLINSTAGLYDVTTVTGTYTGHQSLLQNQVWWGDSDLAHEFLYLISEDAWTPDGLGYPNTGYNESPHFAFAELAPDKINVWTEATGCFGTGDCTFQHTIDGECHPDLDFPCVWAVATSSESTDVSEPSSAFLVLSGGLICLLYRKRITAPSRGKTTFSTFETCQGK